jgi:hypothetical protein
MDLQGSAPELARKLSWMERIYAGNTLSPSIARNWTPSFFVIGPPRTGTTWLYEILKEHAVLPSPTKETRFFDAHFHRGLDWYRAHFAPPVLGKRIGEIAPTYFASNEASERIARHVPNAKVICVFRNPAERVVSLYKLKRAYGLIPWTLEQAITRDPEMLESSKYATRLKQWQSALGQDQVMATFYNDLVERPQEYLNDVVDFIGIPRIQLSQSQQLRIHASETMTHPRSFDRTRRASTVADWFKARRLDRLVAAVRNSPLRRLFLGGGPPFADIPQEIVSWLYQLFRAEVEELETMLNRDLSMWKEA